MIITINNQSDYHSNDKIKIQFDYRYSLDDGIITGKFETEYMYLDNEKFIINTSIPENSHLWFIYVYLIYLDTAYKYKYIPFKEISDMSHLPIYIHNNDKIPVIKINDIKINIAKQIHIHSVMDFCKEYSLEFIHYNLNNDTDLCSIF